MDTTYTTAVEPEEEGEGISRRCREKEESLLRKFLGQTKAADASNSALLAAPFLTYFMRVARLAGVTPSRRFA